MHSFFKLLFWGVLFVQCAFAGFTIHVLNPWKSDTSELLRDSLRMLGNNEVGYYPGTTMIPEGNGWFYYTYKTETVSFEIVNWIGPASFQGRVVYPKEFRLDSLFTLFPSSTNELWIAITDTNVPAQVYDRPPGAKVLYLSNPWPNNSPQMIIGDGKPFQMHSRPDICGWYTGFYVGPSDSLWNVKFTDYFHTQQYTAAGLANGPGIDLLPVLNKGDTVYILPSPFPNGAPELSAIFPGKTGECGIRRVTGLFRDWNVDTTPNPSFFNKTLGLGSGFKNMVQDTLSAPDYKPKKTTDPNVVVTNLGRLETWYVTQTFPSGSSRATNDTSINLILQKSDDGSWEYNSDLYGGFFPLDSFVNPNNIQYWDEIDSTISGAKKHNYNFTMEMHLQFIYHQGANFTFDFSGDDDIWVFINNRLAVDLGGLSVLTKDTTNHDVPKMDLGLVDGATYPMDIFYAERDPVGANFRIKTSLDIQNAGTGTRVNKTKLLHARPLKTACKIIQMGAVSGKYFSMTGRKLDRKNIPTQPLVKVQDK